MYNMYNFFNGLRSLSIFINKIKSGPPPELIVPNNALIDENGNYILDEYNNFIIVE